MFEHLQNYINVPKLIEIQAKQSDFLVCKADTKHHKSAKHIARYSPNSKGVVKVMRRNIG